MVFSFLHWTLFIFACVVVWTVVVGAVAIFVGSWIRKQRNEELDMWAAAYLSRINELARDAEE